MNKIKEIGLVAFAGLAFMLMTTHLHVSAGILDTIKDTVTGHIDDAKSRFDTDREVLEAGQIVKSGSIDEDAIGQDFIHNSEGDVSIQKANGKYYLVLSENFDSSVGPDYHVYISNELALQDERHFDEAEQIELGKLQYGNGYQFYEIPADVDVSKIKSFLLWCKAFGAYIGSADLL